MYRYILMGLNDDNDVLNKIYVGIPIADLRTLDLTRSGGERDYVVV